MDHDKGVVERSLRTISQGYKVATAAWTGIAATMSIGGQTIYIDSLICSSCLY